MSSYFPSFNYLGINSRERGLVVSHFDADTGEHDTFLGMEPIYTESADGSRRLDYGARYNNVATFRITVIEPDGGDFSVSEIREHLRWLTGSKQNSPLEMVEHFTEEFIYDGKNDTFELINTCDQVFKVFVKVQNIETQFDEWEYDKTNNAIKITGIVDPNASVKIAYGKIKYSFIGRITNAWQYKMDARTVGLIFEFTSVSPWAYSARQTVSAMVGDKTTVVVDNYTDDLYGYTPVNVTFRSIKNNLLKNTSNLKLSNYDFDNSSSIDGIIVGSYMEDGNGGFHIVCENQNVRWWAGVHDVAPGQNYAMSIRYKINSGTAPIQFQYIFKDSSDNHLYYYTSNALGTTRTRVENGWTVLENVFTIPNDNAITNMHLGIRTGLDNTSYTCNYNIRRPKLEQNSKVTDWTPHPDDPGFDSLKITNNNIQETTLLTGIVANEIITLSDNMMIKSDNSSKIFGNTFNFVFPRLVAGRNNFAAEGYGNLTFEYVYAIKIGDCAMNINSNSAAIYDDDGYIQQIDTLPWSRISSTPTTLEGYGITNVYSKTEVDTLVVQINIDENILNQMLMEELS